MVSGDRRENPVVAEAAVGLPGAELLAKSNGVAEFCLKPVPCADDALDEVSDCSRIQCGRNGAEGKQHGIAPSNCRKRAANFAAQALLHRQASLRLAISKRCAIAETQ